ncbi:MAG TPA: hypothetical protein DCK95_10915 [Anaerolineaceae bacterium]|nr:hypothetical protein [Anaerolineaceae bacterium]
MVTSKKDYGRDEVTAAKSVLLEVMHILGDYSDDLILIGGWVPELLFPDSEIPHVGSTDVDILVNHNEIDSSRYATIRKLLEKRGYSQSKEQPFIFYRNVSINNRNDIKVQVDFLAGEYLGTGKNRRTQIVQDIRPRKVHGGDFAFSNTQKIKVDGKLPNGAIDHIIFNIISLPAFIILKGIALKNRFKEKDAWDIYFCLQQFDDQIDQLANQFKGLLKIRIVQESLGVIHEAFSSINDVGPNMIADFEETAGDERELIKRDSFERINKFLSLLN